MSDEAGDERSVQQRKSMTLRQSVSLLLLLGLFLAAQFALKVSVEGLKAADGKSTMGSYLMDALSATLTVFTVPLLFGYLKCAAKSRQAFDELVKQRPQSLVSVMTRIEANDVGRSLPVSFRRSLQEHLWAAGGSDVSAKAPLRIQDLLRQIWESMFA